MRETHNRPVDPGGFAGAGGDRSCLPPLAGLSVYRPPWVAASLPIGPPAGIPSASQRHRPNRRSSQSSLALPA
jgi:hypothetical protein